MNGRTIAVAGVRDQLGLRGSGAALYAAEPADGAGGLDLTSTSAWSSLSAPSRLQLSVSSTLSSRAYSHTASSHKKKVEIEAKRAASPVLSARAPRAHSPTAVVPPSFGNTLASASLLSAGSCGSLGGASVESVA